MQKEQKPSRQNLTQLRKNTRTKADKSGRKRPRPRDIITGINLVSVNGFSTDFKVNVCMGF